MNRPRSREKPLKVSISRPDSSFTGSILARGETQSKNPMKMPTTEHGFNCECVSEGTNSLTFEFKNSYSKKASGMPIKALIDEEMSREKYVRRSSPSLIARLMGLDTLPSPGIVKPVKQASSSSNKVLYKDFHEKFSSHKYCLSQSSNDEYQEYKDVFEVVQVPKKVEKQKVQINKKEMTSSKLQEIDMAFMQPNFNNSASYSSYAMRHRYKELNVEDDLDLNIDFDLPFLQEPEKHLNHHANYSSILMASKGRPIASHQLSFRPEKNDDKCIYVPSGESQSCRKLEVKGYSRPSKEHLCSLLKKMSESKYAEKDEYCVEPTQIVILKPSIVKSQQPKRSNPSGISLNTLQHSPINDLRFPADEIMEFYNEKGACQELGHKMKDSRELSKEITKPMRKKTIPSERKKVSIGQDSFTTSSTINGNKFLASNFYEYNGNSSNYSADSKVTKEARKRLSERLKLTSHFEEMGFSSKASNTLAEMLALSDNEAFKPTLDTVTIKKNPERRLYRENDLFRNINRSKSLRDSSSTHENFQWKSKNLPCHRINRIVPKKVEDVSSWMPTDNNFIKKKNISFRNLKLTNNKDKISSHIEENAVIEREIHVSSEKLKNSNDLRHLCDNLNVPIELYEKSISNREEENAGNSFVYQCNTDLSLIDKETWFEKLGGISSENNEQMTVCDATEISSKETLINRAGDQLYAPHYNKAGSVFSESYKEADQPSPVSVLDLPFEEDSSTNCFKKISSDLQELRIQLQLLKQESANSYTQDLNGLPISDEELEDPFSECHVDMLQEDRDYSYVLDILIGGGILKAELDGLLFTAYHFNELPVSLHIFDRLEKKHKSVGTWSRSDRKLLFDLANSVLADIIKPKAGQQSKLAHVGLAERVWQAVVEQSKNSDIRLANHLSDLRWADLGYDDKELIGKHVENVLQEDLLDELVIELITYVKRF